MRISMVSWLSLLLLAACSGAAGPGADDGGSGGSGGGETSTGDSPTTGTPTGGGPSGTETGTAEGGEGSCGDGEVDDGELCDGADLDGKQCGDLDPGYIGGTLACAANCGSFDASGCEVDPQAAVVALNGLTAKGVTEGPEADKGEASEVVDNGHVHRGVTAQRQRERIGPMSQ